MVAGVAWALRAGALLAVVSGSPARRSTSGSLVSTLRVRPAWSIVRADRVAAHARPSNVVTEDGEDENDHAPRGGGQDSGYGPDAYSAYSPTPMDTDE